MAYIGISWKDIIRGRVPIFNIIMAIIILSIIIGLINPKFWTRENGEVLLRWFVGLGILAMGESMVLISGGLDLSVGSMASISSMVFAYCIAHLNLPLWLAILATMGTAALIGAYHGAFVCAFAPPFPQIMPAFMVTLASLIFLSGLATAMTEGWPIVLYGHEEVALISSTYSLAIIFIVILSLTIYIQRYSVIGRYMYAIGGNIEAARISGVPLNKTRLFVYMYSAILASITGIIFTSMLMTGYPGVGAGQELYAIASNAIGGVSLAGGEGIALGSVVGAFLMTLIRNGLVLMGVSPYWHDSVTGIILVIAVALDLYRRLKVR